MFDDIINQNDGALNVNVGTGVFSHSSQGFKLTDVPQLMASFEQTIDRYHHGLPFDADGNLVVSYNAVTHYSNGYPFTSEGYLAISLEDTADGRFDDDGRLFLTEGLQSLLFGGVDEYGTMPAWEMTGYGDSIEFSFTATDPGNGLQNILSAELNKVYVDLVNTTGVIRLRYEDIDESTTRVISGPAASAGTRYDCSVEFNADGCKLIVNGTEYTSANVANLAYGFTQVSAAVGPTNYFQGTIHTLKFTNVDGSDSRDYNMAKKSTLYLEDKLNRVGENEWDYPNDISAASLSFNLGITVTDATTVTFSNASGYFYLRQTSALEAGQPVLVTVDVGAGTMSNFGIRVTDQVGLAFLSAVSGGGAYQLVCTPSSPTDGYIDVGIEGRALGGGNDTDTGTVIINSISVRPLNTAILLSNVSDGDWS